MKRYIPVVIAFLIVFTLSACACEHEWTEANCVEPQKCIKCDAVGGDALGHEWLDASCLTPKECKICGTVEGEALGHQWQEATCKTAQTCTLCQKKKGKALGHNYEIIEMLQEPTCSAYGKSLIKCTVCGETEEILEKPVEHDYQTTTVRCVIKKTCKNCDYKSEQEEHTEWYFPSNQYIDTCNTSKHSFKGTLTCRGCGITKKGQLNCTDEEFEKIFCAWVSYGGYDNIARFPEKYTNTVMKFQGYILQDCGDNHYRMATSGRYDDVIMVEFVGKTNGRILEDDYVIVYGKPNLLYTYTSTMGVSITIPKFTALYLHYF